MHALKLAHMELAPHLFCNAECWSHGVSCQLGDQPSIVSGLLLSQKGIESRLPLRQPAGALEDLSVIGTPLRRRRCSTRTEPRMSHGKPQPRILQLFLDARSPDAQLHEMKHALEGCEVRESRPAPCSRVFLCRTYRQESDLVGQCQEMHDLGSYVAVILHGTTVPDRNQKSVLFWAHSGYAHLSLETPPGGGGERLPASVDRR